MRLISKQSLSGFKAAKYKFRSNYVKSPVSQIYKSDRFRIRSNSESSLTVKKNMSIPKSQTNFYHTFLYTKNTQQLWGEQSARVWTWCGLLNTRQQFLGQSLIVHQKNLLLAMMIFHLQQKTKETRIFLNPHMVHSSAFFLSTEKLLWDRNRLRPANMSSCKSDPCDDSSTEKTWVSNS